jgi:phosphodiesterase/alkaline phosphatase D-like protein
MTISRREFLQSASLIAATSALPLVSFAENLRPAVRPRFANLNAWPIVQGATDAFSATFVIQHPKSFPFHVECANARNQKSPVVIVNRLNLPGVEIAVTEVAVGGLTPGIDFQLNLIDGAGNIFDRRLFRSLDLNRPFCRFGVVTCMDDAYTDKVVSMWESLAMQNCDFVIFAGDTCYSDNGNPNREETGYARRYSSTRNSLAWFKLPRLIPSFATWDDHDYGANNAGAGFPKAGFTQQLFEGYWGTRPNMAWKKTFGVGSVLEAFGQRFYLMDARIERARKETGGLHWGERQREWLLADLARSNQPSWIINGSQFFGGYLQKDAYEGNHAEDFKDLMLRLRKIPAPLAFISGDVHFSETMTIEPQVLGYQTHEFTSSSIHSRSIPFSQHRKYNPRRVASEWRHNFMTFDVDLRRGWNIRIRCMLEGNRVSYLRDFRIERT